MAARWRITAAAVAALAPATGGCGDSGRDGAAAAADAWFEAVADGRGEDACELMLGSAERAIRERYVPQAGLDCPVRMRRYRERLGDEVVEQIREAGFVADGDITKGRIGVFPAKGPHEFAVVLMQRAGDEWKVASVGIDRTPPGRR